MRARGTVQERLERYFEKGTPEECWVWRGGLKPNGYGQFGLDRQRRSAYAHRVAYTLYVGPIPDGLTLDHLCRNRRCVNPSHLEPVTAVENFRRAMAARTHCANGHPYDESTPIRQGARNCAICTARSRKLGEQRRRERALAKSLAEGRNKTVIPIQVVAEIVAAVAAGETHKAVGDRYGVSNQHVCKLVNGQRRSAELAAYLGGVEPVEATA